MARCWPAFIQRRQFIARSKRFSRIPYRLMSTGALAARKQHSSSSDSLTLQQRKWGSTEPKFGSKTPFQGPRIRTRPLFWSNMTAATHWAVWKRCFSSLTGADFQSERRRLNAAENTAGLGFVPSLRPAASRLPASRFDWEPAVDCSRARPCGYILLATSQRSWAPTIMVRATKQRSRKLFQKGLAYL